MISKEEKSKLVKKYGKAYGNGENDTGATAVQIAILTSRINGLKGHFDEHGKDFNSNRSLLKMIGHRRSLLKYYKGKNEGRYRELIKEFGLRK